jgi:hypothetical protein
VTSFPLIYFSNRHQIPHRYLNPSANATESYWEEHKDWQTGKKKKTDSMKDWKQVVRDFADYNYLCSTSDWLTRKWNKVTKRFDEKREEWLKGENFDNILKSQENDDYVWHDSRIHYSNQYLMVFAANQNESKEHWNKYLYPDYYEEQP